MNQKKLHTQVQTMETMSVLAFFFGLLSVITGRVSYVWPSLALLGTGLFLKPVAHLISKAWLRFSEIIGSVSNRIILTLLFFAVLTPIAFLFRLFTQNPLSIRRNDNTTSYFHERNHNFTSSDLEKMG